MFWYAVSILPTFVYDTPNGHSFGLFSVNHKAVPIGSIGDKIGTEMKGEVYDVSLIILLENFVV